MHISGRFHAITGRRRTAVTTHDEMDIATGAATFSKTNLVRSVFDVATLVSNAKDARTGAFVGAVHMCRE